MNRSNENYQPEIPQGGMGETVLHSRMYQGMMVADTLEQAVALLRQGQRVWLPGTLEFSSEGVKYTPPDSNPKEENAKVNNNDRVCQTCRFWKKTTEEYGSNNEGECRLNPPRVGPMGGVRTQMIPKTHAIHWCGQHAFEITGGKFFGESNLSQDFSLSHPNIPNFQNGSEL